MGRGLHHQSLLCAPKQTCELLQAKVEQRAPHIEVATEGKAKPEVVNIMAALKESMQEKDAPR